ncbi:MAG: helix-turn-helix domain-containing protein [Henriciella sp.]|uniref:TetR/AcrR family transcriptional regulator n=1 Tax=Henriciella sp. TaxID=1968823 RepID=UPI002611A56E|nr:TetR/AcrR family transcriptional regulator [Henriciella sp.]
MAALERLLREKDFDTIGVAELAQEAGVAVGTVYRRFENKQALVPLLFDLWRDRSREQLSHAAITEDDIAQSDLRSLLRRQIRAAHAFICEQAHILRAVHLQGRLRPDLIGEDWKDLWDEARAGNRAFLDLVKDRIARDDLDRAADTMIYLANTALVEKALYGKDGAGHVMRLEGQAFADEMADVIYAYLTLPEVSSDTAAP